MAERRIHLKTLIAVFFAIIFFAIAALMWSPWTIKAISRAGETNIVLEPYLNFMALLALANAIWLCLTGPIQRIAPAWLAKTSTLAAVVLSAFIFAEVATLFLIKELLNAQHVGSRYTNGFVYSPSIGFTPKANFRFPLDSGDLTHTAGGYRGPEPTQDGGADQKTVLMIGGSSTYDIGLPDDQTWPATVGRLFGDQARVLNLGIPGHSTVEHISLASTVAWKYRPDVIVYYIGWNDIRSSHVNETTDYSHFHKKAIFRSFAITQPRSFFALGYVFKKIVVLLDELSLHNLTEVDVASNIQEDLDQRLLDIYVHNVRMLDAITRQNGAIPVFIPQILNDSRLTSDEPYAWIPQLPQKVLPKINTKFNEAMINSVSSIPGTYVIPEVLDVDWQDADFVDRGHFSEQGAKRFACVVAEGLSRHGILTPVEASRSTLETDCEDAFADSNDINSVDSNG